MKRILSVVLAVAMLLVFPACAKKDEAADKTIQYHIGQEPQTLDPQIASDDSATLIIGAIYEGLARLDAEGHAVPGVAKSWTASENDTKFTFTLREDAMWSDGSYVKAADFVFAFRRALSPQTQSPVSRTMLSLKHAAQVNSGTLPPEQLGVTAPDDHTLVVELEYAYHDFPALTATGPFMPCNELFFQETHGKYGLEGKYILSNGPFVVAGRYSWDHGKSIKLARSDNYRGEQPARPAALLFYMDGSDIDISDPLAALEKAEVDAAPLPENQVAKAEAQGFSIASFQDITWGLAFNTQDEALKSETLRKGLVAALPRDKLLSQLPERATAAGNIIGPGATLMGNNYRELAGNADGFLKESTQSSAWIAAGLSELGLSSLPRITVLCPDTEAAKKLVNEMLIAWNTQTGQYFNMQPLSQRELEKAVASGDYQIALTGIHPEQDGTLLSVFRSDHPENPSRLMWPAFDQLLLTAEKSGDVGALTAYAKAESELNDRAIFYPIYYKESYYASGKGVTGILFRPNSTGIDFSQAGKIE